MKIERHVTIEWLENGRNLKLERKSKLATGFDLCAAADAVLYPLEPVVIPCGFKIQVPPSIDASIRSRSGLASKGVSVLNAPGTIDADYRGEVKVILMFGARVLDDGDVPLFQIKRGDRIAQLVFTHCLWPDLVPGKVLDDTERGAGGLGSTGT